MLEIGQATVTFKATTVDVNMKTSLDAALVGGIVSKYVEDTDATLAGYVFSASSINTNTNTNTNTVTNEKEKVATTSTVSSGVIAGVVVGVLVAIAVAVTAGVVSFKNRNNRQKYQGERGEGGGGERGAEDSEKAASERITFPDIYNHEMARGYSNRYSARV